MEASSLSNKISSWSPASKTILTGVAVSGTAILITGLVLLVLKMHFIPALSLTSCGGAIAGLSIVYFVVLHVRKYLAESKASQNEESISVEAITSVEEADSIAGNLKTCRKSLISEKNKTLKQNNLKKIINFITKLAKDAAKHETAKKYITTIYLTSPAHGCSAFYAYLEGLNECQTEENECKRANNAFELWTHLDSQVKDSKCDGIGKYIQKKESSFSNGVIAMFYYRAFSMEEAEFKQFISQLPALIFTQFVPLLNEGQFSCMMNHFHADNFIDKKTTLTNKQMASDDFASAYQLKFDSIHAGMTDEQKAKHPKFEDAYLNPFKPPEEP